MESARFYEFGPFCLDTGNRSLTRDGRPVAIQPRTYQVLLTLIENSGRTVTREDLMAIWGLNVTEGALNYQINQARKALGDDTNNPKYIRTYPKVGFRFIAIVRMLTEVESLRRVSNVPLEEERPTSIKPDGLESVDELAYLPRLLRRLQATFAEHFWYVLVACAIFAAYFGVALLVEIAYRFDRYGQAGEWIALVIFFVMFFGSLWSLSLGVKRTASSSRRALVLSASALVLVAGGVVIGACGFLPAEPVTEASFQTYTAQGAYFKDFCYIVPLGVVFLAIPLHFVVGVERELRGKDSLLTAKLLTGGKPSAAPSGTVYLRTWFLLLLLIGMAAYSLIARGHLFDNLKPGPYMSLFQSLIHVRMTLYFGLAILCLAWYHGMLNELKRECIAAERKVSEAMRE